MEAITAYQYKAASVDSYNSLAAYAVTIPATVTLHPGLLTIVISGHEPADVRRLIEEERLDFNINPIAVHDENLGDVIDNETTDAGTLRQIIYRLYEQRGEMEQKHNNILADITSKYKELEQDRNVYRDWWQSNGKELDRVKGQVRAISLLMSEIFPVK